MESFLVGTVTCCDKKLSSRQSRNNCESLDAVGFLFLVNFSLHLILQTKLVFMCHLFICISYSYGNDSIGLLIYCLILQGARSC